MEQDKNSSRDALAYTGHLKIPHRKKHSNCEIMHVNKTRKSPIFTIQQCNSGKFFKFLWDSKR